MLPALQISLYFIRPLAGDRPPVIVFRSCWVAEGSDLETDLLTPAKRWKQKGNRAEKCYSWGVTYRTHRKIQAHARTHTHWEPFLRQDIVPRAVVTDADMLLDTYKCGLVYLFISSTSLRTWRKCLVLLWKMFKLTHSGHIHRNLSLKDSFLLFPFFSLLQQTALHCSTLDSVTLSVYLECSLIRGQASLSPMCPTVSHASCRQSHVTRSGAVHPQREQVRALESLISAALLLN